MKIAFFEIKGWERNYLKKKLGDHYIEFHSEPLTSENVQGISSFDIISVFIYSKVDKEVIKNFPN